jgi:hypothetical protein
LSSLQIPGEVKAGSRNVRVSVSLQDAFGNHLTTANALSPSAELQLSVLQQSSSGIGHDLMAGTFSQSLRVASAANMSQAAPFVPGLDGTDNVSGMTSTDARVSVGFFDPTGSGILTWNVTLVHAGTYAIGTKLGLISIAESPKPLRVLPGPLNTTASRLQGFPTGDVVAGVALEHVMATVALIRHLHAHLLLAYPFTMHALRRMQMPLHYEQ